MVCLLGWCEAGMRPGGAPEGCVGRPGGAPEGCVGRPDVLGILLGPLLAVLPSRLLDELG